MKALSRIVFPVLIVLFLILAKLPPGIDGSPGPGPAKMLDSPHSGDGPLGIAVNPNYRAFRLATFPPVEGIGVGQTGDYVLANTPGTVSVFKNKAMKALLPIDAVLCAGRMWGHYYFGDSAGNLYRLDPSTSPGEYHATYLTGWANSYYRVQGIDVDHTTGDIYFLIEDTTLYESVGFTYLDLYKYSPASHATVSIHQWFNVDSFGLAIKGNYAYVSDWVGRQILRTPKVGGESVVVLKTSGPPADIAFDSQGNFYFVEHSGRINVVKAGDIFLNKIWKPQIQTIASGFNFALFIGLDANGDIFFTEDGTGDLWELKKKSIL